MLEEILVEDVRSALLANSPISRRAAIRAVYAAVEGFLSSLKQELLRTGEFKLTPAEVALLREEKYEVGGDGSARTRQLLINLRDNIRFTMKIVSRLDPEHTVDYGDGGWEALMDSLKVRDRLMHPKQEADMNVTEEELIEAINGFAWFLQLNNAGRAALNKFLQTPEARNHLIAKALREYVDQNQGKRLGGLGQLVEPDDPNAWPKEEK